MTLSLQLNQIAGQDVGLVVEDPFVPRRIFVRVIAGLQLGAIHAPGALVNLRAPQPKSNATYLIERTTLPINLRRG